MPDTSKKPSDEIDTLRDEIASVKPEGVEPYQCCTIAAEGAR
jgi:hypothetical protein